MAEQSVTLEPSESREVVFEAIPHEAKTYSVSVDGLSGSFRAVVPPVTVDFDTLSVLSIEGVLFSSVTGPRINAEEFLRKFLEYNGLDRDVVDCIMSRLKDYGYEGDALYEVGVKYKLSDAITNCGYAHRSFTLTNLWLYHRSDYLDRLYPELAKQEIIATLAHPITMSKIRGVSLNCIIKIGATVGTFDYKIQATLHYYPTFSAPMPPPAFRGWSRIFNSQYDTFPLRMNIPVSNCFAGGYYYPGIYDGEVGLGLYRLIGPGYIGPNVGTFRVKNLAKVTGEGTVVP